MSADNESHFLDESTTLTSSLRNVYTFYWAHHDCDNSSPHETVHLGLLLHDTTACWSLSVTRPDQLNHEMNHGGWNRRPVMLWYNPKSAVNWLASTLQCNVAGMRWSVRRGILRRQSEMRGAWRRMQMISRELHLGHLQSTSLMTLKSCRKKTLKQDIHNR